MIGVPESYAAMGVSLKVYVAGPMRKVAEFNFPEFNATTLLLRAQGHEVFNPAERDIATGFDPSDMTGYEDLNDGTHRFSLREALGADVAWISEHADAICVLPGWWQSKGALAEMHLAAALGLKAGYLDDFMESYGRLRSAAELLDDAGFSPSIAAEEAAEDAADVAAALVALAEGGSLISAEDLRTELGLQDVAPK